MMHIAIKMLVGNRGKYFGMVFGVFLSAMIITQQSSIFTGLISRTFGFLTDTTYPDIWVMDPMVQYVDDFKPMTDTKLLQVRGIDGVASAVPLYKGVLRARLEDGSFQQTNVIGLDDASLTGGPPVMLAGSVADLRKSDGIIVDEAGNNKRFAKKNPIPGGPKIPLAIGDTLEINDKRGVVVGIARVQRTFQTNPVIYTTYSRAMSFAPKERKLLTYILVKVHPGTTIETVAARITKLTGLQALTNAQFSDSTVTYFLKNTGIPINFGIAVILGLIIGTAICGQTFYGFTLDNVRYFGALKAMGASNVMLLKMIFLQALLVGLIGYGSGTGVASLFYFLSKNSELAFRLPWQILAITGCAVTFTCLIAALLSMLKVIFLEPAIVFKGE
jgi:putative ABC transport system permease protein